MKKKKSEISGAEKTAHIRMKLEHSLTPYTKIIQNELET